MLNGRLRKIYDQDFHIDITGAKHVCNRSMLLKKSPLQ